MAPHSEDDSSAGRLFRGAPQRVDVERVDREYVAVVAVAFRRSGTVVRRHARVAVPALRTGGGAPRAGARIELRDRRRDSPREPVPISRSSRRVRIETGDRKALGSRRRAAPRQLWRLIPATGAV